MRYGFILTKFELAESESSSSILVVRCRYLCFSSAEFLSIAEYSIIKSHATSRGCVIDICNVPLRKSYFEGVLYLRFKDLQDDT